MRKSLLFLFLATAAVPAMARPDDESNDRADRREAARAERVERAEARPERQVERTEARPERQVERSEPAPKAERQVEARVFERSGGDRPATSEQHRDVIHERVLGQRPERNLGADSPRPALEQRMIEHRSERNFGGDRPTMERRREAVDSVRDWRARERYAPNSPAVLEQHNGTVRGLVEPRREIRGRDAIGSRRAPIVSRIPREGTQPPLQTSTRRSTAGRLSSVTAQHWRNHWRSDHRYDWRNHRRRHRSLFHFSFYSDPFGWNYRPYSIGWRMWPSYYRSSYWLNDPWQYRLPYAPAGYRWIRYFDDALLVDTWDGQVVDVIYNFFW